MNLKKCVIGTILMFGLLLSCGAKKEAAVEQPATGLKGEISVQVEEAWKPYYEAAVARVKEKNPDAKINLMVKPSFDHIDIIDKTDSTNADVADVFTVPLDRMEGLVSKDVLASFDAKALGDKIGGFGDFDKGLGGQLKFNGNYFGFPYNIETLILGVNTKNAAANNVDLKNIDFATLDPKVAMVPLFNAWYGVAVTNAFGVELLGKDGDKFMSTLTNDFDKLTPEQQEMFKGMFEYWQKSNKAKLPMFDTKAVYGFMDGLFKGGSTGSVRIIGPWEVAAATEISGKEDFDVLPLNAAKFAGKELKHWKGGWALVINSRNEEDKDKMALSQAVIAELLNPKFAGDLYAATGKIMPNVSKDEYAKLNIPELDKKVILAVIDGYDNAVARPLFKEWGQVWDTWQNSLISWDSKKPATVQDAYKEIQASFNALLTNLK